MTRSRVEAALRMIVAERSGDGTSRSAAVNYPVTRRTTRRTSTSDGCRGGSSCWKGEIDWFATREGLNNEGYLSGFPKSHPCHLSKTLILHQMCVARWGAQYGNGFIYADVYQGESPRMQRRIEVMYQRTHQRPIGKNKVIGVGFARGILAEKLGYAVNWAAFAHKQCHRGKKGTQPFQSFDDLKQKLGGTPAWPENEVEFSVPGHLEGTRDDWKLNLKFPEPSREERFDMRKVWGFRFQTLVEHPLHSHWPEIKRNLDKQEARVNVRAAGGNNAGADVAGAVIHELDVARHDEDEHLLLLFQQSEGEKEWKYKPIGQRRLFALGDSIPVDPMDFSSDEEAGEDKKDAGK
ncbi:hypothetical protein M758_UG222400 [Ceratodon purpureus]|nr:hypothetical protein M758_UG222400 [Ceratodon purpureus]